MAASTDVSKASELSKAEYLKRYLSADDDEKKSKKKIKKKRPKVEGRGLKIVDDDVDWRQTVKEEKVVEEEEDEAPVIAEVIDDRPDHIIQLETFRTSDKWKVIGVDDEDEDEEDRCTSHDAADMPTKKHKQKTRHDSPDASPPRRARHDSPDTSPPRKAHHDSPDTSPPRRRVRHDSPDVSPPRRARHDSPDASPPRRRVRHDSSDVSPPRQCSGKSGKAQSKDSSPTRRKLPSSTSSKRRSPDRRRSPPAKTASNRHDSDSDQSPPRKRPMEKEAVGSDQSPPRRKRHGSDSDQSPPRRRPHTGKGSDEDLSPPRRPGHSQRLLSGGTAGLVSVDVLRKEKEDNRQRERKNQPLEDASRNAHTVFRDKGGKRRDLDRERDEQKRKDGEKAAKDEKYAQWGRGLAQGEMHQEKLDYAVQEAQKPLARHRDDEDLDRMLREQEREGDPMAAMLRRKKACSSNAPEKPRYKGPQPPLTRFNIQPGYRWDGVDRSNGFEQKYFKRKADKKAGQEAAYKWSVEDM